MPAAKKTNLADSQNTIDDGTISVERTGVDLDEGSMPAAKKTKLTDPQNPIDDSTISAGRASTVSDEGGKKSKSPGVCIEQTDFDISLFFPAFDWNDEDPAI